ncbi:hypothetical protein D030_3885B, partial [Vibrio parahaemolyticus AQ3810]
PFQNRHRSCF